MAITVYHAEARRSERVAWLLEELEEPYELSFTPGDVFASVMALKKIGHPFGMAPVVRDGEELLIESGAILETLLNRYGKGRLRPALDAPNHHAYLEWLHFAEATAFQRFEKEMVLRALGAPKSPEQAARRGVGASAAVLRYVDGTLAAKPYLTGPDFTAADIQMQFVLRIGVSVAAERRGPPTTLLQPDDGAYAPYPNLKRYVDALSERPGYRRMMQKTMPLGWPPF
jgi:glutathione S-transferase